MEHVTHEGVRLAYRDRDGRSGQGCLSGPGSGGGTGSPPPVLLLHGLAGHMGEWDALAELLVIPDAGHDVHLDQPARLHAAATAFLADAEGVAATDHA
ncbi:hypothetical protein H1V43_03335 [Streptomyces sp. PSKA54]|uniref:Alpha/beta hydrolase n=1 Tax=Streptomyces himalayensis subsp. aureolus TaxID=2758039 RepID=A0A7W2HEB2_9ACTN|nr:hypothetical protein [Streptomyces himalayensis]MBA4860429.1 hypothetical protein [Streptomyces himalayensis subsp. aureolus]